MTYSQAVCFLSGNYFESAESKTQIMREIEYFMRIYKPFPRMFIAYDRVALFCEDDPELRMTFDTDIRYRTDNLTLGADGGEKIIPEGYSLLEIKATGSMPLWLTDALCSGEIYPVSFSKYGKCYTEIKQKSEVRNQMSENEYQILESVQG
jgi:SPX domain protein involved in polyphosphate accumulation